MHPTALFWFWTSLCHLGCLRGPTSTSFKVSSCLSVVLYSLAIFLNLLAISPQSLLFSQHILCFWFCVGPSWIWPIPPPPITFVLLVLIKAVNLKKHLFFSVWNPSPESQDLALDKLRKPDLHVSSSFSMFGYRSRMKRCKHPLHLQTLVFKIRTRDTACSWSFSTDNFTLCWETKLNCNWNKTQMLT